MKRIRCRVVNSVPLANVGSAPPNTRQPHDGQRSGDDVVAVNVHVRDTGGSATYTGPSEISSASTNYGPVGRVLDCYV